ncbi:UDP-N-acetylmuramoylalanyl-D-glutamyl-2,6- diaminopimelate--D-alanyl-D-alanine ligase [Arcticibacter svalbardensis MN12-7]|uniref:Alanine racemase n=1 Tax=Arcticibacter svalbardensis MN12-7 TaxID=1150600 RepID=R9GW58_9SPHI|nr:bifunctional UDP-N-acetylmuramoyl-tripeptide:D-alanyl-D-alanine ligase/alanine racemase [Arcticibacter svalbardensis]EOR95755.1 UDP-N-acetylmuramoylalanyl-D-glutamyl-2,6- diaminopimelate--D-alanyl-D-alanine ligase [Arcticibacter svalbardensis MN12-7]
MYHITYSLEEIKNVIQAEGNIPHFEYSVRTLAFDSRKLVDEKYALFFALSGRRNGDLYIKEAYQEGVRNFVVHKTYTGASEFPDANFLLVDDTLKALQDLVAKHRKNFSYPVIAITGSNGKTIVKEWLYQLLGHEKNIIRSPKSYNSQIGVPLSVWNMNEKNNMGIFEAGISRKGEMTALKNVIRPSIGVLTNIGEAHNEGFDYREDKIAEKLILFKGVDLFVYSPKYLEGYTGTIPGKKKFTWAFNQPANLNVIRQYDGYGDYTSLTAVFKGEEIECMLPFKDAASIENAVCCWALLLALKYDEDDVAEWIEELHAVRMRMELKTGINNCSIIDDSYSLDISSLAIALDFLNQQNQHPKRTLILSEIPEAGISPKILYKQIAELLESKSVDRLIGVGPEISSYAKLFSTEKTFFPDTATLISQIHTIPIADETILLKGARKFEFEQISKILTQKVHETVLEINLNALENNLNHYKAHLKPGVKLMAMVKAFSYGSGSFEIANVLQFNRVDYLAVAYADEGISLREAGVTLPIMVMNPDLLGFEMMIADKLEPEIYSLRVLNDFIEVLKKKNKNHYPIHIKLDTGMHRLGFSTEDIGPMLKIIAKNPSIVVKSAFSHFTSSEDPLSDDLTHEQINLFTSITNVMEKTLGYSIIKHIANTSAISRFPEAQFDMVRLGIGLYGIDGTYPAHKSPLETVARLKTCISQIRELKKGDTVGYNRRGVMTHNGRVATVKIGYADGYNRQLGNGTGKMLVNGFLVPTIGNICMDMCMLDITGIPAEEGDDVLVFDENHTVNDIADQLKTIPYEVLTSISQRVKRIYYYE